MKLNDILNPNELARLVAEHYISRVAHPHAPLTLYNYTEKATYDRVWTPETRHCRGLVVDDAGRIVAWPFDKFHNVGETPETALEALVERDGSVEMTDKLDGSMIALWCYDGVWQASTRGSFTSTQARAAMAFLRARPQPIQNWPQTFTLMAEWCAPDNRVVLKYDQPALTLIGARSLTTGADAGYGVLEVAGDVTGLPVVRRVEETSLEALIARTPYERGVEGWVVRWPDGFRVKVKCADYLRLHRLFSGFGPGRIREAIIADTIGRYLEELPEELRSEAEAIIEAIQGALESRRAALKAAHARLAPLLAESRKAYALAVQREPAEARGYLFSLADGKPIDDKLLMALDLAALFGAETPTE